ncbi:MAG: TRAM domain-containing protein, partial [Deltaproteobacteria bacterium]|nr:TRAM domain-containing protein [Deltaproteobacteria bacterium]
MKIKSQIKVTIENLNHNGQGVGVINGFNVIVDGSAPGDTLLCEITSAN